MAEPVGRIPDYTSGGREPFFQKPVIQDAVARNFEIIGEAAKRLSENAKASEPEIPWREVVGLRDILIHDHMGVDLVELWNVVEKDLPKLQVAVSRLLIK